MAGRRWAEGGSAQPDPPRRRRRGADHADRPGQRSTADGKPAPHPDAMRRAKERLEPPKAPWHPLPLAELAIVLGALAMLVSAVVPTGDGIIAGFILVLAGTAEFSLREHRAGFRSHGAVLSGIAGFMVGLVLWRLAGVTRNVAIAVGVVVFLLCWAALDRSYTPMRMRETPPQH